MLLSTAIALAHEGGCFEYLDVQSTSASQEGWKQQWNQVICVFLHLADENLAMRLGLNPLLSKQSSEVIRNRYSTTFASILPDAEVWESYYDLSIETREASILLQSLKQSGLTLDNANLLPELEHIERALVRWERQHAPCFDPSTPPPSFTTNLNLAADPPQRTNPNSSEPASTSSTTTASCTALPRQAMPCSTTTPPPSRRPTGRMTASRRNSPLSPALPIRLPARAAAC